MVVPVSRSGQAMRPGANYWHHGRDLAEEMERGAEVVNIPPLAIRVDTESCTRSDSSRFAPIDLPDSPTPPSVRIRPLRTLLLNVEPTSLFRDNHLAGLLEAELLCEQVGHRGREARPPPCIRGERPSTVPFPRWDRFDRTW